MMDWLLSVLSDEWFVMYIAFRMLHYLPIVMTLIYIYMHIKTTVKVQKYTRSTKQKHQKAPIILRDAPLLKWRRQALPKLSDETHRPSFLNIKKLQMEDVK
ncbi:hypothetical protein [Macrococcus sp. DPC7161]|uniref:hypothetical protein n=1 Tax=Macrococcus sp. DPC7161 TaxID=2507060 RepID=UPI00100B9F84|nr:hypothetical protein [Macrococcus sp. DPC7161]RXK18452.1 hypothetical protein ER639_04025 [Macrococcus sp. DPC7161]